MTGKDTSKTQEDAGKEEKAGSSQGFPEMCRQMMAGGMPDCCGPQMKAMMARMMSGAHDREQK